MSPNLLTARTGTTFACILLASAQAFAFAQEGGSRAAQSNVKQSEKQREQQAKTLATKAAETLKLKPRDDGLIPANATQTVLIDRRGKRVLLKTKVVNNDVQLEMFLCQPQRKEHESIVVLDADAIIVHAALLAVGAKSGAPVKFRPKYVPSTGQVIDVFVNWKDKEGKKHRRRAQEWIRNSIHRFHQQKLETLPAPVAAKVKARVFEDLRYITSQKQLLWFGSMSDANYKTLCDLSDDKAYRTALDGLRESGRAREMEANFVFAGSFFYQDERVERFYTAEGGYVICVSNWSEALIDVSVRSSDSDANRSFEAWQERIPPVGTEVTVELIPRPGAFVRPKKKDSTTGKQQPSTKPPEAASPQAKPAEKKNSGA